MSTTSTVAGRPSASSTRDSSLASAPANSGEACTLVRKCSIGCPVTKKPVPGAYSARCIASDQRSALSIQ